MIYFSLLFILVFIVIIVKNVNCSKAVKEVTEKIKPVRGNIQTYISTTGIVEPQNRVEIMPPISGRIEKILVREGDEVKTGQVLAWMSSTERAALLDAARPQGEEILKYWEEAYKPTPLIAPIDGEVIVKEMKPGQTITPSVPVLVLADRLIVKAQVDETDIGIVKEGQSAVISLDAYPEIKVEGAVDHIAYESRILNNVTIYEVDILPESVPEVFRSGMSADVDIIENKKEKVLIVPIAAVQRDEEGAFVLVSQGRTKKAIKRKVETGISDDKNIEIVSGLDADDEILIKSQDYKPSKSKETGSNPFMPFGGRKR